MTKTRPEGARRNLLRLAPRNGLAFLACVAAAIASVAALFAQAPVFRADIALVPIDVRVLDKQGHPVTDLTRADFTILENNVRQDIQHFSTHALTADADDAAAPLRARTTQTSVLAPDTHRLFLLVLGAGNLTGPADGVDGLIHLVRNRLLPQDRVAVMGWNRATEVTTDRKRILGILERFKREHLGIDGRLRRFFLGSALQAEIDAVFGGPRSGLRTIHGATLAESGLTGRDLEETMSLLMPFSDPVIQMKLGITVMPSDFVLMHAGIEFLRHLDGEKHLVYLGEYGLWLSSDDVGRNLGRTAADARVVLDIIRAGGVQAASEPGYSARRELQPAATSRTLAEMTGGRFDANRMPNASVDADNIDETSRFEYLLGYSPSNANWDGNYRDVVVKVNRPGVTVLFRHGYFARREILPFDRRGTLTVTRISDAASRGPETPDLGLKATAAMSTPGGPRTVAVTLTVDIAHVAFTTAAGRHAATLELAAFCLDGAQKPVGNAWQTLHLDIPDATYAQRLRDGIPAVMTVVVTAPAKSVKLVAYDYDDDLVGAVNVKVQ